MSDRNTDETNAIAEQLSRQAKNDQFRISAHAHQEMVEENILLDDLVDALKHATLIENYPEHRRGPCCLICGLNEAGRYLHIVCTTSLDPAIIITVYEPKSPKWITPFTRGKTE